MIDFPASPSVGSVFSDGSGRSWTWDGVKWTAAVATGGAYVAKTGDTMSGPLLLSGDPSQALGAATKQYVDANYSGFVNKFRNGTMDVWQRGTSVSVPAGGGVYTADGWIVNATGATCVVNVGGGAQNSYNSLVLNCASGLTQITIQQRIESYVAAPLSGKRITVQFVIGNSTGAALTPLLGTYYANAQDNWGGGFTQGPTYTLSTIASGATQAVAYTFDAPAGARNSYSIMLQFGNQLNKASGYVAIGEADIRVTPGWPVGICANPPPPEMRNVATETAFCERYYQFSNNAVFSGNVTSGNNYYVVGGFRVKMRANPTFTPTYSNAQGFPAAAPTVNSASVTAFQVVNTANAASNGAFYQFSWTASAEL